MKKPPLSKDEKPQDGGGPEGGAVGVAEEREVEAEAASAKRLLQDFIDGTKALDLPRLETDDLDGLGRLVSEAQQTLAVVKRRVAALKRASA